MSRIYAQCPECGEQEFFQEYGQEGEFVCVRCENIIQPYELILRTE